MNFLKITRHEKKLLNKAAERNWNLQLIIAIEEMSELTKVLTKILRYGSDLYMDDLAEETAHVTQLMKQLVIMYGNTKEVNKEGKKAIKRLEKIVESEE